MRLLSENQWPGNYTEEGYERAKVLALESGLDEDPGIKSLLEQRNPCHPSPASSSRYKIELYSSMKNSLEIATNIKVGVSKSLNLPMGAGASGSVNVGIDVNVEKNEYAESHEIMDMQVEFGPYIPKKATAVKMGKVTSSQSTNSSMSTGKLVAIIIGAVVVAVGATIAAMKFLLV